MSKQSLAKLREQYNKEYKAIGDHTEVLRLRRMMCSRLIDIIDAFMEE